MLLAQQLASVATKNTSRAAFHYLGKDINYGEVRTRIARLSYLFLHDLGAQARVAFFASNHPSMAICFFALSNTRAVSIPLDPRWSREEIEACLRETKATHLAVTSDLTSVARELLQTARLNLPLIEIEKKQGGEYDTSYSPPADNPPAETDTILLLRTGSGGSKPRFAAFNHKQLQFAAVCLRGKYHVLPSDRILTPLSWANPFAWVHGVLFPLLTGSTCVVHHGAEAKELLDFLINAHVTRIAAHPPFFLKLLVTYKNEKRTPGGIKSVTAGLGELMPELQKAFQLLKIGAAQCYGQTENVWTISMQDTENPASGGTALAGLKYKVIDANGDEIPGPDKRTGPLAVSGPTVMTGYPGKEKETKLALRGTWLHTGDIATLEGEGEELRITFLGRKDEVLAVDGDFTPLREIDRVFKGMQGIQDGASFLVKDSQGESRLVCAVIKIPGSALTEQQIIGLIGEKLPSGLVPKAVAFTDYIPRDFAQNVQRGRLSAQFSGLAG